MIDRLKKISQEALAMFTVIVTLDAEPDRIDEFAAVIAENARLSVELEPGCLVFDVNQSTDVAGRFFLYEVYVDEAAFVLDHKGSEHFARFVSASAALVIPGSKREIFAVRTIAEQKRESHDAFQ
jgi:autoinducer 2-degrading protein